MYVNLVKVLSSFIFVCFLFIKALSIERTIGSFLLYNSPYELFTSTLNNRTSFAARGSLAQLHVSLCIQYLDNENNGEKSKLSPHVR